MRKPTAEIHSIAAKIYIPVRRSLVFFPCIPTHTNITHMTSQTLYRLLSLFHSSSDGASAALRSLTACAIQSYPGYASGENTTAAVYDSRLTIPRSPSF